MTQTMTCQAAAGHGEKGAGQMDRGSLRWVNPRRGTDVASKDLKR